MTERSIADQRNDSPKHNTDRELWREVEGDYYADSIHVTEDGRIGINCGGRVLVAPIRTWHRALSGEPSVPMAGVAALVKELVQAEVGPRPDPVCPHCQLPAVLPEVCTPEINEAIEANLTRDWSLLNAGYAIGRRPDPAPWQPMGTMPDIGPILVTTGTLTWIAHHPIRTQANNRGRRLWWMALPVPPERP